MRQAKRILYRSDEEYRKFLQIQEQETEEKKYKKQGDILAGVMQSKFDEVLKQTAQAGGEHQAGAAGAASSSGGQAGHPSTPRRSRIAPEDAQYMQGGVPPHIANNPRIPQHLRDDPRQHVHHMACQGALHRHDRHIG